jgi:exodeoxyribonuclease VII large subunit
VAELTAHARLVEHRLAALSPLATLSRGYAIVTRREDGKLVQASTGVTVGAGIDIRLARGSLGATVTSATGDDTD